MRKSVFAITFMCVAMFLSSQTVFGFAGEEVQFFLEEVETPESVQKKIDSYNVFLLQASALASQVDDEEYDLSLIHI